jgi:hypothetical protein
MLWNEREAIQRAAQTPATGLPVGMGMEALTAGFNFTRAEETSTSLQRALWEEFDSYLDTVEQRTGKRVGNPIGIDRIGAAQKALTPGQGPAAPPSLGAQLGTTMQDFEKQIGELRAKTSDLPAPPSSPELLDRITARLGSSREWYQDLSSRMTSGGGFAAWLGGVGGAMTDPVVAGTAPAGAAAFGVRGIVSGLLVEAGVGAASQALIEPGIHQTKEAIKSPYSVTQSVENILASAVGGAALPLAGTLLHAGGSAAVRRLGRLFPDRTAVSDIPEITPGIPPGIPGATAAPETAVPTDAVTADELAGLTAEGEGIDRAMAALESARPATEPPPDDRIRREIGTYGQRSENDLAQIAANHLASGRPEGVAAINAAAVEMEARGFDRRTIAASILNRIPNSDETTAKALRDAMEGVGGVVDVKASAVDVAQPESRRIVRPATDTERSALAAVERDAMVEESSPLAPDDLPAHVARVENDAAVLRDNGTLMGEALPPDEASGAARRLAPPIDPVRAAEVERASTLDDATRAEIAEQSGIRAYHGSPHAPFSRFSSEFIGTGEGAQAFGYGHYFAESDRVGKGYQDQLSSDGKIDTTLWAVQESGAKTPQEAADWIDEYLADAEAGRLNFEVSDKDKTELVHARDRLRKGFMPVEGGTLYTVDLAVSRSELLDWDKPLSEQPPKVREALEALGLKRWRPEPTSDLDRSMQRSLEPTMDRGHVYYAQMVKQSGGETAASEALRAAGIRGIQYLDAGSRAGAEGTRNLVIFDDSAIHIREVNGNPVEAAKALAEFNGSDAEAAILEADVERALGAKAPPEPAEGAPKPAEPPKPVLDPELASKPIPVAETADGGVETRTAGQLLDELDSDQKALDAMGQCAAPIAVPGAKK